MSKSDYHKIVSMMISGIAVQAIGLIIPAISARILGPTGKGLVDALLVLSSFIPVLLLSGVAVGYNFHGVREPHNQTLYFRAALSYVGIVACVVNVVIISLWEPISAVLFKGYTTNVVWMVLTVVALDITMVTGVLEANLMIHKKITSFNTGNILQVIIKLLLVSCAIPLSIKSPLYFGVVAVFAMFIRTCVMVSRINRTSLIPYFEKEKVGKILKFGVKENWGNILQKVNLSFDKLYLLLLFQPRALGIYGISVLWTSVLDVIPGSITPLLISRIATTRENGIKQEMILSRLVLFFNVLLALFLSISGYYLLPVIFGAEFRESVFPMLILLPGCMLRSWCKILTKITTGIGKPEINSYSALISFSVYVPLLIVLCKAYYLNGVAAASLIAYSVYTLSVVMQLQKHIGSISTFCLPRASDFSYMYQKTFSKKKGDA